MSGRIVQLPESIPLQMETDMYEKYELQYMGTVWA